MNHGQLARLMREPPRPGGGMTWEERMEAQLSTLSRHMEALEERLERIEAQQLAILEAFTQMRKPPRVEPARPRQMRLKM